MFMELGIHRSGNKSPVVNKGGLYICVFMIKYLVENKSLYIVQNFRHDFTPSYNEGLTHLHMHTHTPL